MTEEKGQSVSVFCHLTSVICYLTPETLLNIDIPAAKRV